MSRNGNGRSPWTIALVQGTGILGLFVVGIWFTTGVFKGRIHPAEYVERLPHYRDVFVHALIPTLSAAGVVAVLIAIPILYVRVRRMWAASAVSVRRARYRRQWRAVCAAHDLTAPGRNGVPGLRAIATAAHADVLTVQPLPSQSAIDWDAQAPRLARAFGASSGRVTGVDPRGTLALEFARPGSAGLSPAGGGALTAPVDPPRSRPDLVAIRAWSVRVSWARVQVRVHDRAYQTYRSPHRARWIVQWQWRTAAAMGVNA